MDLLDAIRSRVLALPDLAKFAVIVAVIVGVPRLAPRIRLPSMVGLLLFGVALGHEVRELDWRLYSDHDAVRPVVTYYPRINFDLPRKASSRCRFRPVVQHALNKTSLVLARSGSPRLW